MVFLLFFIQIQVQCSRMRGCCVLILFFGGNRRNSIDNFLRDWEVDVCEYHRVITVRSSLPSRLGSSQRNKLFNVREINICGESNSALMVLWPFFALLPLKSFFRSDQDASKKKTRNGRQVMKPAAEYKKNQTRRRFAFPASESKAGEKHSAKPFSETADDGELLHAVSWNFSWLIVQLHSQLHFESRAESGKLVLSFEAA